MKTISIVIPIYKIEESKNMLYFKELINSIKDNILISKSYIIKEIVVVNDKPDSIAKDLINEIFSKFQIDELLIYIQNNKNIGQAASRNLGATYSNSDYIHFIDQDDYIDNDFYEKLIKKEVCLSLADIKIVRDKSFIKYFKKGLVKYLSNKTKMSQLKLLLLTNISYSPGQYIVLRKSFENVNGFPDLKNKGTDDYGFLFNLVIQKDVSFSFNPDTNFYYRLHSNQNKRKLDMNISLIEFFNTVNFGELSSVFSFIKFLKLSKLKVLSIVVLRLFFFNGLRHLKIAE